MDTAASQTVAPVIPSRTPFAFDAWLPGEGLGRWSSARDTLTVAFEKWEAQIEKEQLQDVMVRLPTTGLFPTDGAMTIDRRDPKAPAYALTPHAVSQLVNIALQKVPHPGYMPHNLAWYAPRTRSMMYAEVRDRSARGTEPVIFRTYVNQDKNVRTIRAVVTPRHGLTAFDDRTMKKVLAEMLPADSKASYTRSAMQTNGHVVLPNETPTGCGSIRSVVYFRNSEVGGASLSFSGGAYLSVTDTVVDFSAGAIERDMNVMVESEHEATRRRHTAPARFGVEEKTKIAEARMRSDIKQVTEAAKELPSRWNEALTRFPEGMTEENFAQADLNVRFEILLDAIEEKGGGFEGNDRETLKKVLTDEARLGRIPQGSAAHIAAAYAVAGREAPVADARRFQQLAGQWILTGWTK